MIYTAMIYRAVLSREMRFGGCCRVSRLPELPFSELFAFEIQIHNSPKPAARQSPELFPACTSSTLSLLFKILHQSITNGLVGVYIHHYQLWEAVLFLSCSILTHCCPATCRPLVSSGITMAVLRPWLMARGAVFTTCLRASATSWTSITTDVSASSRFRET